MNQSHGTDLERAVESACDRYAEAGVALIRKVPTPIRVTGTRKLRSSVQVTGHFERKAICDFVGVALRDLGPGVPAGAIMAVECKSTVMVTLPLSAIEPQQRAWLDACRASWVLVEFAQNGELRAGLPSMVRLVPWHPFRLVARGSIGFSDGVRVAAVDWLRPVIAGEVGAAP